MKITPEQFAEICYLTLMQNGEGLMDKSMSYIEEKQDVRLRGTEAFGALDINNQTKVILYLRKWGYDIPEDVNEYFRATL